MFNIPKKVIERANLTLKNFQKIAESHRARDVSEADTVTLVKDILADVFGFDKYSELTSEQQIRGTFCDLAVKIDGKIRFLIEVKPAGADLNDNHLRQAINYAANEGIEWVALTNAVTWRLFRVKFTQPINTEEIVTFSLLSLNPRVEEDQRRIYLFSREGLGSDAMNLFHQHAAILNPYTVAQVIAQEGVVSCIRRELKKIFPDVKVSPEDLLAMLKTSILKRELVESDKATEAVSMIKKHTAKIAKQAAKKTATTAAVDTTLAADVLDERTDVPPV